MTDKFVATLRMQSTERLLTYHAAGADECIESMQLIKPSNEIAILFKIFIYVSWIHKTTQLLCWVGAVYADPARVHGNAR